MLFGFDDEGPVRAEHTAEDDQEGRG